MALGSHSVLVCVYCGWGRGGGSGRAGIDCWDDGAVVLVFEEVFGRCGVGFVEGILEGRVEGAEGEFVDYVREVERCNKNPTISDCAIAVREKYLRSKTVQSIYRYDPNAARTPYTHVLSP